MAHQKIDVHHHILPQVIVELLQRRPAITQGLKLPEWSSSLSLAFMDRNQISASILSLPIPVSILAESTSEELLLCREVNAVMANLRDEHPSRFGFFATVPSPGNAPACIEEIRYALKRLGADGVMLFTSYGGRYLGHPDFQLVWQELASHAALVFIHPTIEGTNLAITEPVILPRPLLDWPHETTRTAVHLLAAGTLRKYPGCSVILSHGGGTLPYIANRAADLATQMRLLDRSTGEFVEECKTFYFDIALAGYEGPLRLLLDFAGPGNVLYGSDFPFAQDAAVVRQAVDSDKVVRGGHFAAQLGWEAAERLLPRLLCVTLGGTGINVPCST